MEKEYTMEELAELINSQEGEFCIEVKLGEGEKDDNVSEQ